MPCDKLVLLTPVIQSPFRELAEEKGERKAGYSRYLDLRNTLFELPVRLYCGGIHNGINKLQFDGVAHLGLKRTREIVKMICGNAPTIRISRIDWCVDILGISVVDLAHYCRMKHAQSCRFIKSRSGTSVYARYSGPVKILMYDRVACLRAIRDPLAKHYGLRDALTRVEVQLRGKGIPFRNFQEIERFAETDLLSGLTIWKFGRKREGLTVPESLAAEGLLDKIEAYGLQAASKMYSAQTWDYLSKKFLVPASESKFPDLNRLMRRTIRDWLENRIRFPRLPERVQPGKERSS